MTIIYLHQYFNTPGMQGGTRSYEIARRFVQSGHRVHMITTDREPGRKGQPKWRRSEHAGIDVHWLRCAYDNRMGVARRLRSFAEFAYQARTKACKVGGDVVFATSTPLTIGIPGVLAARRLKIPHVFEVRDLWPAIPIAMGALKTPFSKWGARRLEKWVYDNSDQIVALAPGMRDGVIRAGVPSERVHVVPNSCDFDLFDVDASLGEQFRSEHEWLGNRPLFSYLGTMGRVNDLGQMVKIAEAMKPINPEVRFAIVGAGGTNEQIAEQARQAGVLNENLFMLGSRPKQEIPKILSATDIASSFCIAHKVLRDNSANKVFDALAAGKPIAVNHHGWLKDLIVEQDCGLHLERDQPMRMAHMLNERLADRNWLQAAGRRGKQLGKDRFDRDMLSAQLESVLLQACRVEQPALPINENRQAA